MKKSLIIIFSLMALVCKAGRVTDVVELRIAPAGEKWTVKTGTDVTFKIELTENNIGLNGVTVDYEISEDLMTPRKKGSVKLKNGMATIKGGSMKQPGFLRCKATCKAEDRSYSALGTIGFSPEKIRPVTESPDDFISYWNGQIEKTRLTELRPEMKLLPEKCTDKVNVYQVSFSVGAPSTRFYGMLAMPKGDGSFPAIVQYPGAGVYAIDAPVSFAEQGIIAMAVGIHSIPNDLSAKLYADLEGGPLKGYPTHNMERRDEYYYNRVIKGTVRAVDFIETLPEFNGCVATYGGSQGGYLSIATAALHGRVKFVVANFPAMSDLAGYAHERAGGWPHIFKSVSNRTPLLLNNLSYYDTVNFARHINVPGFYAFGFNDLTCAPTTTYAVYNTVTAPKELYTAPLAGHFLLTEQAAAERSALVDFLKACNP